MATSGCSVKDGQDEYLGVNVAPEKTRKEWCP